MWHHIMCDVTALQRIKSNKCFKSEPLELCDIVRCEIRREVLSRIHVFWGMMLWCYVSSDVSEYHIELTFYISAVSSLIL